MIRFFFKQKTAYEMRMSDWSSDVCSSDLPGRRPAWPGSRLAPCGRTVCANGLSSGFPAKMRVDNFLISRIIMILDNLWIIGDRSEEHTSELQSLMRNSYAVFCLKKKKTNK